MTSATLHARWRSARWRRRWVVLTFGLPLALLPSALAWRLGLVSLWWPVFTVGLLGLATVAALYARRLDRRWLLHTLDAHRELEDSTDLLFADEQTLGPLQRLQRKRVQARLETTAQDLREPWPKHRGLLFALVGWALLGLVLTCPFGDSTANRSPVLGAPQDSTPHHAPHLQQARLHVAPPSYTGLPPADLQSLDTRQPEGTLLQWRLRFSPQPTRVALHLSDNRVLSLQRSGEDWTTQLHLQRTLLYRLSADGAQLDQRVHRIEALPDRPAQVRVIEPDTNLVQWNPTHDGWSLQFEASDDYGVAARAGLKLTIAQGSGENITFREQTITLLSGSGPATRRSFAHTLQPQQLGMVPGSDLIAQLIVHDNRQPSPQETQSASVILRWPPAEQAHTAELEGNIKKTLPAYFRSQRQIIIDSEALLKRKHKLDADTFLKRSDAIGVDQHLLRLRYGQFLGEESEGAPEPPPVADSPTAADTSATANDLPTADLPVADAPATGSATAPQTKEQHGAAALDPHDTGQTRFGQEQNVLAEFGHSHDHAEATTLLDPQTRSTLKAALDQMWQSEAELRQGHPERALAFAYNALKFIKQVQQSERVYLARTGPELPPIDESRRLNGDRAGLERRGDALLPASTPDPAPRVLWQSLGDEHAAINPAQLDAFAGWLASHESQLDNALDIAAALENLRVDLHCNPCRQQLRALMWTTLSRPAAQVLPRPASDATGQRYIDALQRGSAP